MHGLAVAIRTAALHEPDNTAVQIAVADFMRALRARDTARKGVWVGVRNKSIFVDDDRLRIGPADYLNVRFLSDLFDAWGLGGIEFGPALRDGECRALLYILNDRSTRGFEELEARVSAQRLVNIELTEVSVHEESTESDRYSLRAYAACLQVYRDMQDAVREHRHIRTRRLRRVTQAVVDQVLSDEQALLAMTTIKQFDDYLFTHSANVAILSVALGQRLGLDKRTLGELCLAAFLHDLGKMLVPRAILDKPATLDDEEWESIRDHPIHAVSLLLRQEQLSQSTLRAIVAGFEHHLNVDLSGYPPVKEKQNVTLFGRIIALVDRYDAYTTPRSYRSLNYTPYEGMRYVVSHSGSQFDPVLVKLFLEMLGLYPPGTCLSLDTGEIAVVRRPPPPGAPIDRPTVQLIRGEEAGKTVDLNEQDGHGRYLRNVHLVLNPDNDGQLPALSLSDLSGEAMESVRQSLDDIPPRGAN
ncbi:MAG: hypothetical protein Kow00129_06170 [Thermoleophilia bacterium]